MRRSADPMGQHGFLRLARSVTVTTTVFSLAAGGHILADGTLPAGPILLALFALVLLPVTWLAGRQLSFTSLLAVLGVGQFILHHAFTALSRTAACTSAAAGGVRAHHAGMPGMHCASVEPAPVAMHVLNGNASPAMLAAHMGAVAVTAWLLWKGEVALWQLLAWLRPLVPGLVPVPVLPRSPRSLIRASVFVPVLWRTLRVDSPRGPPFAPAPWRSWSPRAGATG